uniref:C-type lectin domain-containing protein n=1 Tax=Cuerna arida TaxID=1464854 RepID=A0A1B6G9L9_9HEMI
MIKVIIFQVFLLTVTRAGLLSPRNMTNTALVPECLVNEDCPTHKACVRTSCVTPCDGRCGNNTECIARDHIAACSCLPGYSGHPFSSTGCLGSTNQVFIPRMIGHGGTKRFHAQYIIKKNWFEAFIYCQTKGQQLATIQSKQENEQFLEAIKENQLYKSDNSYLFWTAGTDLAREGEWYWMTTGLSIDGFTDWHTTQPDNIDNREHCLGFADRSDKKWHDADCKNILTPFVCESYE